MLVRKAIAETIIRAEANCNTPPLHARKAFASAVSVAAPQPAFLSSII
jgi:hypothetical protein